MTEQLRRSLITTALEMNRSGLNQGTSGNLSVRSGEGMLITPSGLPYEHLNTDDIVYVAQQDGAPAGGTGQRMPSSEWRIHRDVYRARPDAQAILHAHPVHSTALACLRRPLPAFHYMVAVAGGRDIRCAPYATFGSQTLSDQVLDALQGRKACLMANHGLLALSSDLAGALALAQEIEQLARSYLQCLAVGEPAILDDAEMDRVLEKFKSYGQR
jgi:L-fuculose-phosphate aldolase